MAVELLTPFVSGASAVELSKSGLYRKQILRFKTINYTAADGTQRKITFDRKYGDDLIRAFRDGAYDQVPFQLATPDNKHNNDPTRTGGEVVGVELSADGSGLDGIVRLWGEGRKTIARNPKLGVSARIFENLTHSDGRAYSRALQHVLGTVDPQMTGMNPWQKVELSNNNDGEVSEHVDLSGQEYRRGGMPNDTEEKHVLELTTAQRDRLTELLQEDEALKNLADQLPPGFFDDEVDEDEADDDDEDEDDAGDEGTDNQSDSDALEMTNARLNSQESRIVELTQKLQDERLKSERETWLGKGLAPAVVEMAAPLLAVESGAVELSNNAGTSVDPGDTIRQVLNTVVELASAGRLMVDTDEIGTLMGDTTHDRELKALDDQFANYF